MRVLRVLVSMLPLALASGCGYVHFGRLPKITGDAALQQANFDLTTQQKILKQELALARKENDTLRDALERANGAGAADLTRTLEATTRELAQLRASYAMLQAERAGTAGAAGNAAKLAEVQQQLTDARRDTTQLQQENVRLRRELDASRTENAALAVQLKSAVAEGRQSQATIDQLNADLTAQKSARQDAERTSAALRAQLDAVVARASPVLASASAANTPPPTAPEALEELQAAKAPPSGAAELHINLTHYRNPADSQPQSVASIGTTPPSASVTKPAAAPPPQPPSPAAAPAAAASPAQTYTVQSGDTLEKIAVRVYGAADQWTKIYAANADVLTANQGLKPSMQLQIPPR